MSASDHGENPLSIMGESPTTAENPRDVNGQRALELRIELDTCLNLAMQQNGVPLLKELEIRKVGQAPLRDLIVRVRAEPAFAEMLELRLVSVPAGERYLWSAPKLQPSPGFLAGLRERIEGLLHIEVIAGEQTLLAEPRSVVVLAYDQWGGLRSLPELLCAFVLPNHPAVVQWLRRAAGLLEQWSQDPSLLGYQSKSRERVVRTTAAVFHALQTSSITYVVPPASFEREGQKVRTPDRIAEELLATCLDLALLSATCLEQAGLHPLVVLVEGHAFAGVWLDENSFPEPAIEDAALLAKRVELGEIVVFDPTMATGRPLCAFEDAVRAARERLAHPESFRCAIDVARSRKGGIRPLPLRADGVDLQGDGGPGRPDVPARAPDIALPRPVAVATAPESPASRIERWKRRLLDLTNRNRLLNFKETKKTVQLECTDPGRLEDMLANGRALTLRERLSEMDISGPGGRPVPPETLRALVDDELSAARLVTRLTADELETRLTEIFRAARVGLEEGGASGLYVAFGFLEWFESSSSDQKRRAPLLLVPVDLQRGSIRQGFKMTRAADETRFNTTLLEMLNVEHHVQINGVDPLPEDEHGIDVVAVFQQVRAALRDVPRWRVIEEASLGFFTFTKFLMWKDLDKQAAVLLQNHLVSHLVNQPDRAFDPDWREPDLDALDDTYRTADLHCPVLADSSQLAAVIAAADGKSFVLEGPPGTGKSQTITNLIAHCLSRGKTVLFVSEKTAALNVVFDRLKKVGLERFCLELHSNKASKLEVVRRLGESLRGSREHSPEEWSSLADELDRIRADLNAYAHAIRRLHRNGLSVFRATSLLTALRNAPCIDLGWQEINAIERERLDATRAVLRDAQNALRGTGDPHGHALEGTGIEDVPPALAGQIRENFAILHSEIAALTELAGPIARPLSIDLSTARMSELRLLSAACAAVLEAPQMGFGLIACDEHDAERSAAEACTLGRRRDEIRTEIARNFDLQLTEIDLVNLRARVREASYAWILTGWLKLRTLRKQLLCVTNPGVKPTLADIQTAVELALQLKDIDARLGAAMADLRDRSGADWRVETSPWRDIEAALAWSQRTRASFALEASDPTLVRGLTERLARWVLSEDGPAGLRASLETFRSRLARVFESANAIAALLRLASNDPWRSTTDVNRLGRWRERMDRVGAALSQLKPWALWRRLRARLIEHNVGALVSALEDGSVQGEQLTSCFDRSYYEAWLGWARSQERALRDFLALSHEQRIERFRELDGRCTQLARKVVAAKLSARVPNGNMDSIPGSELGILQRQLQMQRRHLGLRQLFQQTRNLVQKLKPCFLMSPVSVAQYLPPGALSFDLVVFDEASQIPTWDAVGAIARGKQAVVVGDSKQLPPTSFFDAVLEDDGAGAEVVEELESILDECRAARVPPLDLRWHYRSRHETLIAFSNRKYYENRLNTFPSAHFDGLGVQWRHVPGGAYDKGRSRTNRAEAEVLVADVLRRLRDPELSRDSIGVVTFSSAQQEKVEDLLDNARREDPALDHFFIASDDGREPVFIKNLENVQGDERDVILFSICYGPDETGRVAMNFGPLNRPGGERRLNVAVTRARRELVVFSTLTADQIDLARTRARGVADLKAFLSYAQHGLCALPAMLTTSAGGDEFDSPLEKEICEALRSRGHTVHSQVGCAGYRIDLAVVDPDRPGAYMLGIECDGRNYHSAKTARDRDRLRQSVLVDLGWKLVRVWSSDWWEARDEQLDRLSMFIEDARRAIRTPPPAPPPPELCIPSPSADAAALAPDEPHLVAGAPSPLSVLHPSTPVDPVPLPVYRARRGSLLGTQEDFYDPAQSQKIHTELCAVVEAEGPIRLELAAARVAKCFGFERTRQKVVDRIDEIARIARLPRTEHGARAFLWPRSVDPRAWRVFRTSRAGDVDARDAVDLPPQEVANAAAHLLATNGACPRLDLQRALSRLFGFKALGGTVARCLDEGIEHLIAESRAGLDAYSLVLPAP